MCVDRNKHICTFTYSFKLNASDKLRTRPHVTQSCETFKQQTCSSQVIITPDRNHLYMWAYTRLCNDQVPLPPLVVDWLDDKSCNML